MEHKVPTCDCGRPAAYAVNVVRLNTSELLDTVEICKECFAHNTTQLAVHYLGLAVPEEG